MSRRASNIRSNRSEYDRLVGDNNIARSKVDASHIRNYMDTMRGLLS